MPTHNSKWNKLSLGLLIALPFIVKADPANQLWLKCSKITDPTTRLACFDNLASKQAIEQKTPVTENQTVQETELDKKSVETATLEPITTELIDLAAENKELLAQAGVSEQVLDNYTPLSKLYDLDENAKGGILGVRAHNPNYILPFWYNDKRNKSPQSPHRVGNLLLDGDLNNTEVKFQVSFKTKVWEDVLGSKADMWFGYTQQSYWQLYNTAQSSPFRATNYEPEIFITQPVTYNLPFNGKLRMLGVGGVHQSNGEAEPLSRGWNRVYGMAGMEWGKLSVVPRVWWRVPERTHKDDNPDITDYMGYGDLKLGYQFGRQSLVSTMTYNPKHNKGGVRLEYAFPIHGNLKGYVQAFDGYGENLLDYNHRSKSIGLGIMLYDWGGL